MKPSELTDQDRTAIEAAHLAADRLQLGVGIRTLVGRWLLMTAAERADLAVVLARLEALDLRRGLTEAEEENMVVTPTNGSAAP